MSIESIATKSIWVVYYVGAVYGNDKIGEVVSRHRTEDAAIAFRLKLQSNPRFYGSNTTVREVAC